MCQQHAQTCSLTALLKLLFAAAADAAVAAHPSSRVPLHCTLKLSLCRCIAALAGRNGPRAYDYLSQALKLADAALKHPSGDGSSSASSALPPLAPPSPETAVEGDVPPPLTPVEVRYSALTWIGRCGCSFALLSCCSWGRPACHI